MRFFTRQKPLVSPNQRYQSTKGMSVIFKCLTRTKIIPNVLFQNTEWYTIIDAIWLHAEPYLRRWTCHYVKMGFLSTGMFWNNHAMGIQSQWAKTSRTSCWSQARINWEGCKRKGIQHKIEGVAGVVLTAIFSIGLATRDGTVDTIPDPFVQTKSRNITRQDRAKVWALPRGRSHMPATNRRWKWETPDQL